MKRMLMTALVLLGLFAPAMLSAHDKSLHKGKPTEGEVVETAPDRFTVKTANGAVTVTHSPQTVFEHGKVKVDKTHVTKGGKVTVFGTKLPTGELVAKEVLLGTGTAATHKAAEHGSTTGHSAMGHGAADNANGPAKGKQH